MFSDRIDQSNRFNPSFKLCKKKSRYVKKKQKKNRQIQKEIRKKSKQIDGYII